MTDIKEDTRTDRQILKQIEEHLYSIKETFRDMLELFRKVAEEAMKDHE